MPDHLHALIHGRPQFAGWSADTVARLASAARTVEQPAGSTVHEPGEPASAVYLVERGILETLNALPGGARHGMGRWHAGSLLGLEACFGPQPALHKQAWMALTDVALRAIPLAVFKECLNRDAAMAASVLAMLAGHIDVLMGELSCATLLDAQGRVARRLLSLSEPQAVYGDRPRGAIMLSQTELARMLGLSRHSINRALNDFEALGLILNGRQRITVTSPQGLQAIVDGAWQAAGQRLSSGSDRPA